MRVEQLGSPILRKISQPVEGIEIGSQSIQELIATMKQVLDGIKEISPVNGNAIAAPQVGSSKRVILLRIEGEFVAMINPKIIDRSEELFSFTEECFSFYHLRGQVARNSSLTLGYLDEGGSIVERSFSGELSALIQHEVDHLDGVVFLDRINSKDPLQTVDFVYRNDPSTLTKIRSIVSFVSASADS